MTNRDTILQILEWIEEHLKEPIPISELAKRAGYSMYHFIRLFQGVTGFAPKEYITRRKLTEAAKELLGSRRKISDVAFDYSFNDHETFTRAFKRLFGVNPAELRMAGFDIQSFFEMPSAQALTKSIHKPFQEPEIIQVEPFSIIGLVSFVGFGESMTELWASFRKEVPLIRRRLMPERFCQLAFWSDRDETEGFNGMPSVEVEDLDEVPLTLVGKTVPGCIYLCFTHRGSPKTVGNTYRYIYESYLPQSEYRLTRPFTFERYDRSGNAEALQTDIYIPLALNL